MTLARIADWLEMEATIQTRFITSLPPGNMSEAHRRARLSRAKLYAVQASALRHGYKFPDTLK